jgi:hypothetical protein
MKDNNRQRPSRSFDSYERDQDSSSNSSLTRAEQDHRHKIQNRYLNTFRFGQVCGLIYNLALLYLVYDLIINGEKFLALQIFVINASIIAFVILTFIIERRISSRRFNNRKPQRRHDNRGDNRNDSRNDNRDKRPVR